MCLGVPGEIVAIDHDDSLLRTGRVSFGGVVRDVSLACVPEAQVGDFVIVHAGLAISVVDEQEARQTLELVRQLEATGGSSEGPG